MQENGRGRRTVFNVEGMNVAWNVSETSEEDVDEEVGSTASNNCDTSRWDCSKRLSLVS